MKMKFAALFLALSLTLTACGGKGASQNSAPAGSTPEVSSPEDSVPEESAVDVDLAEFYSALLDENEWPELMPLEDELLDGFYPGLSDLSLKQCLVNTAAISAAVGEIALVETENAEDAGKIEEIFQARIDYQVGDGTSPGGAWYPMTIEGWETTSRIVTQGNYVMLAVGDAADDAVLRFNGLFQ